MTIAVGDSAPSFELQHRPGETIDLGDHLGREKVVLLFFPLAFSAVCTAELCTVRDRWNALSGLDAVVLGISVDSPFVTDRFRQAEEIPFPLLSDFNAEAASAWGVLYDEFYGLRNVAKRAAFVVGTDGLVSYAWVTEDADVLPDYDELLAAIADAP